MNLLYKYNQLLDIDFKQKVKVRKNLGILREEEHKVEVNAFSLGLEKLMRNL